MLFCNVWLSLRQARTCVIMLSVHCRLLVLSFAGPKARDPEIVGPHDAISHRSVPNISVFCCALTCARERERETPWGFNRRVQQPVAMSTYTRRSLTGDRCCHCSLSPLSRTHQAIDYLSDLDDGSDPVVLEYIKERWGSVEYAQRYILRNFFRFG